MAFIDLSGLFQSARAAAKGAAEGLVVSAVAGAGAAALWRGPGEAAGIWTGVGAAWAASSLSVWALLWGKAVGPKAFWRAFGGGVALRAAVLGGLMFLSREGGALSAPATLLAYVLAVLALLILEYRHIGISSNK